MVRTDRWRIPPHGAAIGAPLLWLPARLIAAGAWSAQVVLYPALIAAITAAVFILLIQSETPASS